MVSKQYYVDSCIWLNLFKKEGDATKGPPYWRLAKSFLEKIMFSENEIIYSGFVLKEIKYKINDDNTFAERLLFLKQEPKFKFVKATEEDYEFARGLEVEIDFTLSFFDCLHIAICQRLEAVLVTRDELLLIAAKGFIQANKPEDLLP